MAIWDFIHTSSFEVPMEDGEYPKIMAAQTRSKTCIFQNQPTIAQDLKISQKIASSSQPTPPLSYGLKFPAHKTIKLEYDTVEDLKKLKANISMMDLCRIPQQKDLRLKALDEDDTLMTNPSPHSSLGTGKCEDI
jgi:hypothetical protein